MMYSHVSVRAWVYACACMCGDQGSTWVTSLAAWIWRSWIWLDLLASKHLSCSLMWLDGRPLGPFCLCLPPHCHAQCFTRVEKMWACCLMLVQQVLTNWAISLTATHQTVYFWWKKNTLTDIFKDLKCKQSLIMKEEVIYWQVCETWSWRNRMATGECW